MSSNNRSRGADEAKKGTCGPKGAACETTGLVRAENEREEEMEGEGAEVPHPGIGVSEAEFFASIDLKRGTSRNWIEVEWETTEPQRALNV